MYSGVDVSLWTTKPLMTLPSTFSLWTEQNEAAVWLFLFSFSRASSPIPMIHTCRRRISPPTCASMTGFRRSRAYMVCRHRIENRTVGMKGTCRKTSTPDINVKRSARSGPGLSMTIVASRRPNSLSLSPFQQVLGRSSTRFEEGVEAAITWTLCLSCLDESACM
jgi:hypothetical protein